MVIFTYRHQSAHLNPDLSVESPSSRTIYSFHANDSLATNDIRNNDDTDDGNRN